MWWGSLPTLGCMTACFMVNYFSGYFFNSLFLGNPYHRDVVNNEQLWHFLRDLRLSENVSAYKQYSTDSGTGLAQFKITLTP